MWYILRSEPYLKFMLSLFLIIGDDISLLHVTYSWNIYYGIFLQCMNTINSPPLLNWSNKHTVHVHLQRLIAWSTVLI